jgi:spore coat protein A
LIKAGLVGGGVVVVGLTLGALAVQDLERRQPPLPPTPPGRVFQTAVDGATIQKYADPLPTFTGARVDAGGYPDLTIDNVEFQQEVLPYSFYQGLSPPYNGGTYLWGYSIDNGAAVSGPSCPAVTIEAQRFTPTNITYVNSLKNPVLQKYLTVDQTLHWANPLDLAVGSQGRMGRYEGPIPVVTHLHGAEVASAWDGGPQAWFTPGESVAPCSLGCTVEPTGIKGPGWSLGVTFPFTIPNSQEAAALWLHDHALGTTRQNVYAGLLGFYFVRDEYDTGVPGTGLNLPAGPYEIELAIQDKMFDENGQILFPDGTGKNAPTAKTPNGTGDGAGFSGPPPDRTTHPFWIAEFYGDVIVVNGKSWPYLDVEPRRYRFRILNGANSRFFNLRIPGLRWWIIGTDGGLLDRPSPADSLLLAPSERVDVIVDFATAAGTSIIMTNDAVTPYPAGGMGPGLDKGPGPAGSTWFRNTVGQIMKVNVGTAGSGGGDASFDPSMQGATLRGGPGQQAPIVRLADGLGGTNPQVTVDKVRMLTLVEVDGGSGQLEVLLNNTAWDGLKADGSVPAGYLQSGGTYVSESAQVGSTERWEIINLTNDTHPVHLHLVDFQLINRQAFQAQGYKALYNSSFHSGIFEASNGPPLDYVTANAASAVGGNPDVTPFLEGGVIAPSPWEAGWKDTAIAPTGQVTRIIARFAPQDISVGGVTPGVNGYSFDVSSGPGYVWHCHILDHEDNEMMRPLFVVPESGLVV